MRQRHSRPSGHAVADSARRLRESRATLLSLATAAAAFILALAPAAAYPNGGPLSSCTGGTFAPASPHATAFQTGASGYVFSLTPSSAPWQWTAGQTSLSITLTATSATYPTFNGHMLGVLDPSSNLVGTISFTGTTTQYACTTSAKNALTQPTNTGLKSLSFTWTAPATAGLGTLKLRATVMFSRDVFWRVEVSIPEVAAPPPAQTAPNSPTGLQITAASTPTTPSAGQNSTQDITIGWSAPTPAPNPALQGYHVQLDNGLGGTITQYQDTTASTTSLLLPGLVGGRTYHARVLAYNSVGNSAPSSTLAIVAASASAQPPPAPNVPSSGTAPTSSGVTLTWPPVTLPSGTTLIAYQVQCRNASDPLTAYHVCATSQTTTVTVSGLAPNSSYAFRVQTLTTSGSSGYSPEMLQSTTAGSAPGKCPNACSGRGSCTPAGICLCPSGYVGIDCATPSMLSAPVCTSNGVFCIDWAVVSGTLIARIKAIIDGDPSGGYTSIGFGAPDGMTGANIIVFTVPTTDQASITNWQCSGLTYPTPDTNTVFDSTNSAGHFDATTGLLDVTVHRPLKTSNPADYVIPSTAGTTQMVGWANDPTFFDQHTGDDRGRGLCQIDWAGGTGACGASDMQYTFLAPLVCAFAGVVCLAAAFNFDPFGFTGTKFADVLLRSRPSSMLYAALSYCCTSATSSANTAATSPTLRLFDQLTLGIRPTLRDMTYGELFLLGAYAGGTAVSIIVAYASSAANPTRKTYVYAHLSAFQFALVFLPVTRNSIWTHLCGVPYERAIKFHRWLARILLVVVIAHGACMAQLQGSDIWNSMQPTQQGSGVAYGTASFVFMLLIVVLSVEPIRRRFWEAFFLSHLLFVPAVMTAVYHDRRVLWYLCLPLGLFIIDHMVRFYRSHLAPWYAGHPEILSVAIICSEGGGRNPAFPMGKIARAQPRIVRLELKVSHMTWHAGDYVFLNLPSLARAEWHPLSISNSAKDPRGSGVLTLHILDCGAGSWTYHLAEQVAAWLGEQGVSMNEQGVQHGANVASNNLEYRLPLLLDGPYGKLSCRPLEHYGCIVLCGGGVGSTPMMSILQDILYSLPSDPNASRANTRYPHLLRIHLIWTCRSATSFEVWYPELLASLHPAYRHMLRLHLHFTGPAAANQEKARVRTGTVDQAALHAAKAAMPPRPPLALAALRHGPPAPPLRLSRVDQHVPVPPLPPQIAALPPTQRPRPTILQTDSQQFEPEGYIQHRQSQWKRPPPPPPLPGRGVPPIPENRPQAAPPARALPPPPPGLPGPPPEPPLQPSPLLLSPNALPSSSNSPYGLQTVSELDVEIGPVDLPYGPDGGDARVINGRPCFPLLFDEIQREYDEVLASRGGEAHKIVALACGPDDMVLAVQKAAMERSWHLHKETFSF